MFYMAECGRSKGQYRRPNLGIGDDLDAENVCESRAAVGTKCTEDQVLALLVEDEDTAEHVVRAERPQWPSRRRHKEG
jgi:hypothetical protein